MVTPYFKKCVEHRVTNEGRGRCVCEDYIDMQEGQSEGGWRLSMWCKLESFGLQYDTGDQEEEESESRSKDQMVNLEKRRL